MIDRKTAHRPK